MKHETTRKDREISSANKRRIASKLIYRDKDDEDVHNYDERGKEWAREKLRGIPHKGT